ncbi:hypothetical protein Taro_048886 [Colocasia esculenta]|uniref:Uncharacterized protein n=1 Tax=Colocasia esculenta TaxID=4460 RepID=A0A843X9E1_COLES|nr:hypothetical protein [Colocasia esculenta]
MDTLTRNYDFHADSCYLITLSQPTGATGVIPYLNTRLNLPQSPGSHRTLRELLRELHHGTAFPRAIQRRYASHDPPTTLQNLLEALETPEREAGAREEENQVRNLPSGEPITCRILRLASTPLPPRTTATLNVHIYCRQDHAVNVHSPGRQSVNGHPWPPTPTELQQVLFHFRTNPALHLVKPHIHTIHSIQPTHIGLTTAATTTIHTIRMDPKSTRRYIWHVFMTWLVGGCDFYRTADTRPSAVQLLLSTVDRCESDGNYHTHEEGDEDV